MLPYIELFGHQISMYALCIMAGVALGILVAVFRAKLFETKREDVLFASIYGLLGLVAGGKILYLLTVAPWVIGNLSLVLSSPEIFRALLTGGFVFYGGLMGAIAGIFIYAKQYGFLGIRLLDLIVPAVPLIHAFGRMGCFCAGCCFGRPFPPPIGLSFDASGITPQGVTLFPVQLLEAACNFILFFVMIGKFRKNGTQGEAAAFYLAAYGVIRFLLEFLRYDRARGFLLGFSTSQWISVGAVFAAVFLYRRAKGARHKK